MLKHKLVCFFGKHKWLTPVVADLDTYWLQCGKECLYCGKFIATRDDVKGATTQAYAQGYKRGVCGIESKYGNMVLDKEKEIGTRTRCRSNARL